MTFNKSQICQRLVECHWFSLGKCFPQSQLKSKSMTPVHPPLYLTQPYQCHKDNFDDILSFRVQFTTDRSRTDFIYGGH
jgi:hypothetical protein